MKKILGCIILLCCLTAMGQNGYKHVAARGTMSPVLHYTDEHGHFYCIRFDITCVDCVIDGNIYIVNCIDTDKVIQSATYHVELGPNGWQWGHDGNCPCYISGGAAALGISKDSLVNLVLHHDFPIDCCQENSGDDPGTGYTPCDTIPIEVPGYTEWLCNRTEAYCCNDTLHIAFTIYNCLTHEVVYSHSFDAINRHIWSNADDPENYIFHYNSPQEEEIRRRMLQAVLQSPEFTPCN